MTGGKYFAGVFMVLAISPICFSAADDRVAGDNAEATAAQPPQQRTGLSPVADKAATRGWESLRSGQLDAARYQFKQALMFEKSNGLARWGMAVIQAQQGEYDEALDNFRLAEKTLSNDIDFRVDFSRTLGYAGVKEKKREVIESAFAAFSKIYEEYPQHGANLQNWAVILFFTGDYAQAWDKIGLAEKTSHALYIDQKFLAELQKKMPRP